jgi:hypothetical protein
MNPTREMSENSKAITLNATYPHAALNCSEKDRPSTSGGCFNQLTTMGKRIKSR